MQNDTGKKNEVIVFNREAVRRALQALLSLVHNEEYDADALLAFGRLLKMVMDNPTLLKGNLGQSFSDAAHVLNPKAGSEKEINQEFILNRLKSRAKFFSQKPDTWKKTSVYRAIGFCSVLYIEMDCSAA